MYRILEQWNDWWHGWDNLCANLGGISEKLARTIMHSLKKDDLVEAKPIFDDCLRLQGKGWFIT